MLSLQLCNLTTKSKAKPIISKKQQIEQQFIIVLIKILQQLQIVNQNPLSLGLITLLYQGIR